MKVKYFLWSLVAVLCLASCKEEDNTVVEEFPDWLHRNDVYYSDLYYAAKDKIDAGDNTWMIFQGFNKPTAIYQFQYYDYVVVEKIPEPTIDNSAETHSPYDTDSVEVHYIGKLIPSTSYPDGAEFDRSFDGKFDEVVATPAKFYVGGLIAGFRTALQHMHRKDHWRIYIPFQLGYGVSATGSIPAFSNLIFDVRLVDYWKTERGDRD